MQRGRWALDEIGVCHLWFLSFLAVLPLRQRGSRPSWLSLRGIPGRRTMKRAGPPDFGVGMEAEQCVCRVRCWWQPGAPCQLSWLHPKRLFLSREQRMHFYIQLLCLILKAAWDFHNNIPIPCWSPCMESVVIFLSNINSHVLGPFV